MKKYLAYGANMSVDMMAKRCPKSKLVGTGQLQNYRLMFKGTPPNSYGTIEPWEGFSVPFVLWDLTPADEKQLDRYEGYPRVYQKHTVEVEVNGEKFSAMYYSKPDTQRVNPPCDHYVAVLWKAYEHFGFDLAILQRALDFSCGDSF
ncbi:MAG: gamma-glutamylcyclotransferase [Selenomonadaceae bacterium]|nr:gamma-glutamylcyclotransferase [Selenomonadaceae bacterium]MBR1645242.1 gamma-glutamylcyclotransferase [Selenomonadaceae bacterium]MBR1806231.1 gamma-glutamylcyclotransferase [Selenomonadaceae bacterium]